MKAVVQVVYDAYLEALKDGAIAEAQILGKELDDLAHQAQTIDPTKEEVIG